MHDLPEVLRRLFTADADQAQVGVDAWPWGHTELLSLTTEKPRRHGREGAQIEATTFNRLETDLSGDGL